jgi:hypothetical protein
MAHCLCAKDLPGTPKTHIVYPFHTPNTDRDCDNTINVVRNLTEISDSSQQSRDDSKNPSQLVEDEKHAN